MASKASKASKPFICPYCKTGFSRERTLTSHMCEKKRRSQQENEKRVQLGFYVFNKFFRMHMGARTDKTYAEFCESQQYNAFVKFGSFLANVKPLYPDKYIDYVLRSGAKMTKWTDEDFYEQYVVDLVRKEGVETALERTIQTMTEWAEDTGNNWNNYFREVSTNRAVWHIKDGKVSPWLIMNCKSGKAMMAKFSDEQLNMVYKILDPRHWGIRFNRHVADVKLVKDVAQQAGL